MKRRRQRVGLAIVLGGLVLGGCQPPEDDEGGAVPPGAVPAAPDVRPGTESAPGGMAPTGAPGNRAMPSDTLPIEDVDTIG